MHEHNTARESQRKVEGQLGLLHSERTIFIESFAPTVVMSAGCNAK